VHTHNQPVTKSNPDPSTKQHAAVSIQLITVMCMTYLEKFTDSVVALLLLLCVVMVIAVQRDTSGEAVMLRSYEGN